jgi:hypothetical protein
LVSAVVTQAMEEEAEIKKVTDKALLKAQLNFLSEEFRSASTPSLAW